MSDHWTDADCWPPISSEHLIHLKCRFRRMETGSFENTLMRHLLGQCMETDRLTAKVAELDGVADLQARLIDIKSKRAEAAEAKLEAVRGLSRDLRDDLIGLSETTSIKALSIIRIADKLDALVGAG